MSERAGEIATATKELIVENGGDLPTVRQIAARSFLSPAAIYVHFPNFDAIVEAVRLMTLQSLRASLLDAKPNTLAEAIPIVAYWVTENQELAIAASSETISDACAQLCNECLVECGADKVDDVLIRLAVSLASAAPMLVKELGYDAERVAAYLHSLAEPLRAVSAMPPLEVIHA